MSHRSIIDRWPSIADFAREVGAPYETAKQWRRRGTIPALWFPAVVDAAEKAGRTDVTLESLFSGALDPRDPDPGAGHDPAPHESQAAE